MSKPMTPAEVAAARRVYDGRTGDGRLVARLCDEIERCWLALDQLSILSHDPDPPAPEADETETWPTGEIPF